MKKLTEAKAEKRVKEAEREYGSTIESGIRPLVVALQAHGFPTSGSCEGHTDKNLFPWIIFVTNRKGSKKKDLKASAEKTAEAIQRLRILLEDFYRDRETQEDQRLDVEIDLNVIPFDFYTLRPRGARTIEFLPREIMTDAMRSSILKRYQHDVADFAQFLISALH